jgi:DNA polymerase-3 subunit delta'
LILIGTSPERQLPTIRSRAQTIRFRPLVNDQVADLLLARGLASDRKQAHWMAELSAGSLQQAVEFADEELRSFREVLAAATSPVDSVAIAALTIVYRCRGQSRPRRARARHVVGFAIDFYRQVMRALCGLAPEGSAELVRAAEQAKNNWIFGPQAAAAAIERSLEALGHIDRNAYLPSALDCWLDDLARIVESGQPASSYAEY